MPAAGIVTLILVLVTVAALAAALIQVAMLLKHVNFTLGTVIAGVRAIEHATRPINPVLGDIAGDLAATQRALDDLLAGKAAQAQQRTLPPAGNGPLLVSRLPHRSADGRRRT